MIVQSLWHDHDLAYREADLARAERIWDGGPAGLTLFTNDGGKTLRYGRPLAYPLAALPFYALFGLPGSPSSTWPSSWPWRARPSGSSPGEPGPARLFVAGFFFASAAFAYAFRLEPDVFLMACGFFPLLVWQRLRSSPSAARPLLALAAAGALLGAALTSSLLLALLALPVLIDLAARRRWRGLGTFAAAILLAAGLLALVQRAGTGSGAPPAAPSGAPSRPSSPSKARAISGRDTARRKGAPGLAAGLRLLPRNLWYLLAGRFTGLLPYFPFALLRDPALSPGTEGPLAASSRGRPAGLRLASS